LLGSKHTETSKWHAKPFASTFQKPVYGLEERKWSKGSGHTHLMSQPSICMVWLKKVTKFAFGIQVVS